MVMLPPGSQGHEVTEAYQVEDGAVACWFCKMLLASLSWNKHCSARLVKWFRSFLDL